MPKEGDLPRTVNMDTPPLETHNRVPVDEAHPAEGVHAEPMTSTPGTDQGQIPGMAHAETPQAPLGPDTLTGSRWTNMPTPPLPRADRDPTAEDPGMYGGMDNARDKSSEATDPDPR